MLPPHADEFPLAHGGFERQLYHWQEERVTCITTGSEQPLLFALVSALGGVESTVAGSVVRGKLDIAYWVTHVYAPFLARDLEQMGDHDDVSFCRGG